MALCLISILFVLLKQKDYQFLADGNFSGLSFFFEIYAGKEFIVLFIIPIITNLNSCIYRNNRFDVMIEKARANYESLGLTEKVTLLEGQAADILPTLDGPYDFIFMDSAKSKYYDFFPECMRLLRVGGMLVVDDVLQGGTILLPKEEIPKRSRAIHKKLNAFLDVVMEHPSIESSIIPLGDGLLLIVKQDETDFSYLIEESKI